MGVVLKGAHSRRDGSGIDCLSTRELEVLQMISFGLTNAEVGDRLDVTVHAVKFHLTTIYRRLGVANRTEAAVTYLRAQAEDIPSLGGRDVGG
jgi:DNA-binding CsgD family transcriptional regulator